MNIVISQPMFLPWAGLFEQMKQADIFVHFDDIALPQGRSFISRVQIKTEKGQEWLTVPLVRSSRGLIREVRMDSGDWRQKHLDCFSRVLKNAPHFKEAWALLKRIYHYETDFLSAFNIHALELIADYLGLAPRFALSSDVNVAGQASEKLLNLIRHFGANCYITGHGAKNYLDHERFEREGIEVRYMDYAMTPYPQYHGAFTPYVTIIDGIAHKGRAIAEHFAARTVHWKEFA